MVVKLFIINLKNKMGIKQKIENVKYEIIEAVKGGSAGQIKEEVFGKSRPIKSDAGKVGGFDSKNEVKPKFSGGGGSSYHEPTPAPTPDTSQADAQRQEAERQKAIENERARQREIAQVKEEAKQAIREADIKERERLLTEQARRITEITKKYGGTSPALQKRVQAEKSREISKAAKEAGVDISTDARAMKYTQEYKPKVETPDTPQETRQPPEKKHKVIFDVPKLWKKIKETNIPFIDKPLWAIGRPTVKAEFIDVYGERVMVKKKDLIEEPPLPEFKEPNEQYRKETISASPTWTVPKPSTIDTAPSLFEQQKAWVSGTLFKIRKGYGETFETTPRMEPLTVRKVSAEVARKSVITVPEGIGYFTGKFLEKSTPDIDVVTPETTPPMKVTYQPTPPPPKELELTPVVTQQEPSITFQEERTKAPKVSREIGEFTGTLGTYAVIPPPVLLGTGLAITTAPKGVVTTRERFEGGVLTGFGALGVAGRVSGKLRTVRVRETIYTPKKYTPETYVSKPKGSLVHTSPSGKQITRETYDVLGGGTMTAPGRSVEVTTPFREFFGFKPIYSGSPYGRVGSKGYKKAFKSLLKQDLTEKQARDMIRLVKPKIELVSFSGVGETTKGLSEQPMFFIKGLRITYRPQLQIGKFKTAGEKGKVEFITSRAVKVKSKKGVDYISSTSEEYTPLARLGKQTKRFEEMSKIKYVGKKTPRTYTEEQFFGGSIVGYTGKGTIKPISPKGKKVVSETSKIFVGQDKPKFKIETDSSFRVSEELPIKSTSPKEPLDITTSPEVSKDILKTLETVYGKPTLSQIEDAKTIASMFPKSSSTQTPIPQTILKETKPVMTSSIYSGTGQYERYSPSENLLIPKSGDVPETKLGEENIFEGTQPSGKIAGGLGESGFQDLGTMSNRLDSQSLDTQTKTDTLTKSQLNIFSKTKTDTKTDVLSRTSQRELSKQREEQIIKQLIKQPSRLKQASESLQKYQQDYLLRYKQTTQQKQPPTRPIITPIIPPVGIGIAQRLSRKTKEEPDLFKVFAFKFEQPIEIGETKTKYEAKKLLIGELKTTLRASGYIERAGKKLKFSELGFLGGEFRPSKVSKFRVTQKKSKRLGRKEETTELQYFRKVRKGKSFI